MSFNCTNLCALVYSIVKNNPRLFYNPPHKGDIDEYRGAYVSRNPTLVDCGSEVGGGAEGSQSRLGRHSTLGGTSHAEFEMSRLWHSRLSRELGKGYERLPPSLQITQQAFSWFTCDLLRHTPYPSCLTASYCQLAARTPWNWVCCCAVPTPPLASSQLKPVFVVNCAMAWMS